MQAYETSIAVNKKLDADEYLDKAEKHQTACDGNAFRSRQGCWCFDLKRYGAQANADVSRAAPSRAQSSIEKLLHKISKVNGTVSVSSDSSSDEYEENAPKRAMPDNQVIGKRYRN